MHWNLYNKNIYYVFAFCVFYFQIFVQYVLHCQQKPSQGPSRPRKTKYSYIRLKWFLRSLAALYKKCDRKVLTNTIYLYLDFFKFNIKIYDFDLIYNGHLVGLQRFTAAPVTPAGCGILPLRHLITMKIDRYDIWSPRNFIAKKIPRNKFKKISQHLFFRTTLLGLRGRGGVWADYC